MAGLLDRLFGGSKPRKAKQGPAARAAEEAQAGRRGRVLKSVVGSILDVLKNVRGKHGKDLPPVPAKPTYPDPTVADIEVADKAIENFLYFGDWLPVVSSNVAKLQYQITEKRLYVKFKPPHGMTYEYTGIPVETAHDFAIGLSKGKWVWDHLRSAGVNYKWISSDDGHVPERLNPQSLKSHARLLQYLERERRKPRFAKLKTRKKLSEVIERIIKKRTPKKEFELWLQGQRPRRSNPTEG